MVMVGCGWNGVPPGALLRRWLGQGLRMAAAGASVAAQGLPGAGGARPLSAARALGDGALLCRVAGRLFVDDPALARDRALLAAHGRLCLALERALDPVRAELLVAAGPGSTTTRRLLPFALLGDLDVGQLRPAGPGPGVELVGQ